MNKVLLTVILGALMSQAAWAKGSSLRAALWASRDPKFPKDHTWVLTYIGDEPKGACKVVLEGVPDKGAPPGFKWPAANPNCAKLKSVLRSLAKKIHKAPAPPGPQEFKGDYFFKIEMNHQSWTFLRPFPQPCKVIPDGGVDCSQDVMLPGWMHEADQLLHLAHVGSPLGRP
ncbi:MAG TPA: hypothetical protein VL588_10710 [Bdellovibrionota bacterium]|jgi:hypothetical protein|nr:hypothetical protein [Bdellovibrionota bacterium]